jgi:hypothetical protein
MQKKYVYRNVNKRPVNISGYQFEEGQELESDILINGFNEAVSNGFLALIERESQEAEPNATPAPQTGNTGKVKVIFHAGSDVYEIETDPSVSVKFPRVDLPENEIFGGWFKDAEFIKPVTPDKAKSPKDGERHFYCKRLIREEKDTPPVNPNTNGEDRQVTLPPLPPPPPVDDKSTPADPEIK